MPDGLRREQTRGLERPNLSGFVVAPVDAADLDPAIYGTPGSIAPDDTVAAGAATTLARSDHRHGFTTAVAAGLTQTATAGEGAASTSARSDHVHSTDQLPWGWQAGDPKTGNTSALATGAATDYGFDFTALATRRYAVCCSGQTIVTSVTTPPCRWRQLISTDGVATFETLPIYYSADNQIGWWGDRWLWLPDANTYTFASTVVRDQGNGTLTLQASASKDRAIWVEDIGPR